MSIQKQREVLGVIAFGVLVTGALCGHLADGGIIQIIGGITASAIGKH
jgi:hypothetical protein